MEEFLHPLPWVTSTHLKEVKLLWLNRNVTSMGIEIAVQFCSLLSYPSCCVFRALESIFSVCLIVVLKTANPSPSVLAKKYSFVATGICA
jgi:hypothetical protein|tara:strand:- start:49 stop:318 length:270 start_codon:yes stop_codon:yes gene_type:complete